MVNTAARKQVALVLSAADAEAFHEHASIKHDGHQERADNHGKTCYLCRRMAGEKGVALQNDPAEPVVHTTVRLSRYRVDLLEHFALEYLLCVECAALIDAFQLCVAPDQPAERPS